MVRVAVAQHDGGMNDTHEQPAAGPSAPPPPPGDQPGPNAQRVRTLTDVRRSTHDKMVAGVAGGVAQHLDIDPVLVRVLFAVLTFVGGAGIVLYAACWLLLPTDVSDRSIVAEWFGLDQREEQVRVVGLSVAAVVAVLSVIGDGGWGPGWGLGWLAWVAFWIAVPVAAIYYVVGVLPRRRREQRAATAAGPGQPVAPAASSAGGATDTTVMPTPPVGPSGPGAAATSTPPRRPRPDRPRWSPALGLLTLAAIAVAVGGLGLVDLYGSSDVAWQTYVATALGLTGVGILAGAWLGNGLWLLPIALVLGAVLVVGTLLPSVRVGQQDASPTSSAQVDATYTLGIGEQRIDLSGVRDPRELEGRTITVEQGLGAARVTVPDGVKTYVTAHVRAGDLAVLGQRTSGNERRLRVGEPGPDVLRIDVRVGLGQVEVQR